MAEILGFCRKPQTKTRVMYVANLSYKSLERYLSLLKTLHFLEIHHSETRYSTTQKGMRFLEKWTDLVMLLNESEEAQPPDHKSVHPLKKASFLPPQCS